MIAPVDPVEAILAVECPQCGAQPKERCGQQWFGRFMEPMHCASRIRAALDCTSTRATATASE